MSVEKRDSVIRGREKNARAGVRGASWRTKTMGPCAKVRRKQKQRSTMFASCKTYFNEFQEARRDTNEQISMNYVM